MTVSILLIVGLLLSFANGANDNLKGVATLLGSGTVNYRRALHWATICTILGSITAAGLAADLLKTFSGKGLVTDAVVQRPDFAAAVACGAGLTVLLATRFGLPVSTTHGLLGALVGAGIAAGSSIHAGQLLVAFVVPLLISPFLALASTAAIYPILSRIRVWLDVVPESCVCLESTVTVPAMTREGVMAACQVVPNSIKVGTAATCGDPYTGQILGIQAKSVLDALHFGSAGLVSFARGLNDTPKIAAVMLVGLTVDGVWPILFVGLCMAAGGILRGQRVAETMSQRITEMNHGQGFTANALSGMIVIAASGLGLPVSTTHVMCGSLFGIGIANGRGRWRTISGIAGAWLVTLPCGMLLGALSFLVTSRLIS
jgi:PiT family inorganic phosphate transporter